jgi:hypothetical protein
MTAIRSLLLFTVAAAALALTAQQRPAAPTVAVVIDAQRGALVRWSIPATGLPRGGFQVERSSGNGPRQVIAQVKPGSPAIPVALAPEKRQFADQYIATSGRAAAAGQSEDEAQTRATVEMVALADAPLAAYLGLSYEDRQMPAVSTVTYTISLLGPNGEVQRMHGFSPTTPVVTMAPPEPPADFRAVVTREGIGFFWSPPSREERNPAGAVAWLIEKRLGGKSLLVTPEPVLRLVSTQESDAPGAVDRTPSPETVVAYTITPIDLFGRRGPASAPLQILYPDFSALDPPDVINASTTDGKAVLLWQAPANRYRKGWKVVRALQPNAVGEPVTPQPMTPLQFTDTNVRVGTTYYYRISAINIRGEEGEPKVSQAVLVRSGRAPAAPTGLAAELKTGRVILTWNPPPENVSVFQVERSIEGRNWNLLTSTTSAEPRLEDVYPRDATGTLQYRVIAWTYDDTPSLPSAVVTVPLPDMRPPQAPQVTEIRGEDGRVTLDFTPGGGANDASGFFILRSDNYRESGVLLNNNPLASTVTRYVDNAVEAGRTYFYRLVAIDAVGNRSEPSDPPAVIRVAAPALSAPPTPRARFEPSPFPRVLLEFAASTSPSVLYALERRDASGRWLMIQGPFPYETTSVIDATPPKEGVAVYRLVTIASNGLPGPRSAEVTVTVPKR